MRRTGWIAGLAAGVAALAGSQAVAQKQAQKPAPKSAPGWVNEPMTVRFPHAASAWSAAADGTQQVHVACASLEPSGPTKLWYLRSDTAHAKWPVQVEVPTGEDFVTVAGIERGPRIAVAADGGVVIAWQSKDHIAVRRSADGGKTWMPVTVRDADAPGGIDMVSMAYTNGPKGELLALLWNDSRGHGKYSDNFSTALYASVSRDGGKTFGKNVWLNPVAKKVTDFEAPGSCPCCLPSGQFDGEERLWVAYRSSDKDVKEIAVLKVDRGALLSGELKRGATAMTVSHDDWHMVGCPMNGPRIAVDLVSGMSAAVIWTKDQETRFATTSNYGGHWTEPKSLGKGPRHAAVGAAGDMWMTWGDDTSVKLARGNGMSKVEEMPAPLDGTAVLMTLFAEPAFVVPEGKPGKAKP